VPLNKKVVAREKVCAFSRAVYQVGAGHKPGFVPPFGVVIIHLDRLLPAGSSNLPDSSIGPIYNAVLFGLASDGVHLACRVTTTAGGLLPHRFTLTAGKTGGGILSVARDGDRSPWELPSVLP